MQATVHCGNQDTLGVSRDIPCCVYATVAGPMSLWGVSLLAVGAVGLQAGATASGFVQVPGI